MGLLIDRVKRYKEENERLRSKLEMVSSYVYASECERDFQNRVRRDSEKRVDMLLATLFFVLDHVSLTEDQAKFVLNRIKVSRLHSSYFENMEESECLPLPSDLEP